MSESELSFGGVPDRQRVLEMLNGEREFDEQALKSLSKSELITALCYSRGFEPDNASGGGNISFRKTDLQKFVRAEVTGEPESGE